MSTTKDDGTTNQGRRDVLKLSLAAGSALVVGQAGDDAQAQVPPVVPPSPSVTPWLDQMPAYLPKTPVSTLTPAPQQAPNLAAGEVGRNPFSASTSLMR